MINVLIRSKGHGRPLLLYFVDPLTGKERSKSAETSNRSEAERKAALWEQELRQYRGVGNDGWRHFRDRFEGEHLAMLSKKSRMSYGTALNHLERLVSFSCVSEITASVLSGFQAELLKEGKPLTSIANYLTHIRTAMNWAAKIGIIKEAPKFKPPRTGKRKFMRGRPITETEYRLMLATCRKMLGKKADPWCRFMELLWFTGFRLSEAMQCSWTTPPIVVNLDGSPYPQIIFLVEGQKSRQDEAIPMCPDFAEWLKKTPLNQRLGRVAAIPYQTAERASELISEIGEKAEIVVNEKGKFASAHDFRRAFGTRWAARVRPLTLQRLMRHANIETTLKYYVGISSADAGAELWSVPSFVPKTG